MKKSQMIENIRIKITEMLPHMAKCGIKVEHFSLPENLDAYHLNLIKECHTWLEHAYSVYNKYIETRALCSEEVWERYDMLDGDCDDLAEVIALNAATTAMNKAFCVSGKPVIFQKKIRDTQNRKLYKKHKEV